MKHVFSLLIISVCVVVVHDPAMGQLDIRLKTGNEREQQTKEQLQQLMREYDISKWLFTTIISVEDGYDVIPHSHPVLTLNTRHLKDDELLLSTLVHEQFHWYLEKKPKETEKAVALLKGLFAKVPVGFPEGANDEMSGYVHLLVCYLEFQADKQLFGELRTKAIMDFWKADHYTWIYTQVVEKQRELRKVLQDSGLLPIQ